MKLLPYFLFEKYILILALEFGNDHPREPALCQLYRHTIVPSLLVTRVSVTSHKVDFGCSSQTGVQLIQFSSVNSSLDSMCS